MFSHIPTTTDPWLLLAQTRATDLHREAESARLVRRLRRDARRKVD